MVRLQLCLLAWWFLSVNYQGITTTVGPFDNEQFCETTRAWTAKSAGSWSPHVSPKCWHGETGYRP